MRVSRLVDPVQNPIFQRHLTHILFASQADRPIEHAIELLGLHLAPLLVMALILCRVVARAELPRRHLLSLSLVMPLHHDVKSRAGALVTFDRLNGAAVVEAVCIGWRVTARWGSICRCASDREKLHHVILVEVGLFARVFQVVPVAHLVHEVVLSAANFGQWYGLRGALEYRLLLHGVGVRVDFIVGVIVPDHL